MKTVDDLFEEPPEKTLYHYTGIGSLLGIVENRTIWASHIYYLNDSAEIIYARDILLEVIASRSESLSKAEKDFLCLFKKWLKNFSSIAYYLFVFSLSEEPNLLSQWRSYTPHGKGVSIGFSSNLLLRVVKAQELKISRCLYDRQEQEELMLGLLKKMLISFGQLDLSNNSSNSSSYYEDFLGNCRKDILQLFSIIKHPSFKEEREWRIITNYYQKCTIPQIKFREGASMLVPYFEINIDPNGNEKLLFEKVILGPSQHNELSYSALSDFLSNKAVCNKTKCSCIPYREWQ